MPLVDAKTLPQTYTDYNTVPVSTRYNELKTDGAFLTREIRRIVAAMREVMNAEDLSDDENE